MRMTDIIYKKKHGQPLNKEEIEYFVNSYVKGTVPDYQVSALLMAIYFQGMNTEETVLLTETMVNSGDIVDLSFIEDTIVDKHSTGGVGDKVSLIILPILASLGVPVAKMSGRGLGHTGGTIDKLESIEGFQIDLPIEQFKENVKKHGICLIGQTGNLVPADKKLYALRDVTETVDSIPLIASSIMSKKIASGADAIVLDVKVGSGAFMKDLESAKKLAQTMVEIGNKLNRRTVAILSNMDQPLGFTVGNKLEVQEASDFLNPNLPNKKVDDMLFELVIELTSQMYLLSGKVQSLDKAKEEVLKVLRNGKAYDKFIEFIKSQGGNPSSIKKLNVKYKYKVRSNQKGYIQSINSEEVGLASMMLGGGRTKKEDIIDYEVGIVINKKVGSFVNENDVIFEIYSNTKNTNLIQEKLLKAVIISDKPVEKSPMIYKVIR